MKTNRIILAATLTTLTVTAPVTQAGWLDGIVQQVVTDAATEVAKDAAKETAKEVARQNGVQGADGIIDTAVDVGANPNVQAAAATGNTAIMGQVAADVALANRQANTPIPASQLQQYPPSIADLNRDGVVTYGEVQQVQKRNVGSTTPWLNRAATSTAPAPTHQPADLNKDGIVTTEEHSAYQAAVAQVAAQNTQVSAPTNSAPAPQQKSSGGLGGLIGGIGGMFSGGDNSSNTETLGDSTSEY